MTEWRKRVPFTPAEVEMRRLMGHHNICEDGTKCFECDLICIKGNAKLAASLKPGDCPWCKGSGHSFLPADWVPKGADRQRLCCGCGGTGKHPTYWANIAADRGLEKLKVDLGS